jgi:RNA polymerase sigma-70 factor (ECF subfamily)
MNAASSIPQEEKELLQQLRDGNETAFTNLFNRYNQFLFIQAYKLTGEEDDAKDIVQNIFINLWNGREKLSVHVPLAVYLSKCVRFGFFKKVRSDTVRAGYEESLALFAGSGKCTTDEALLEQELIERLRGFASSMPDKTGKALILKHLEQYSIAEIADTLQVSPKTVSNMLSRANKDLRVKLGMGILLSLLFP